MPTDHIVSIGSDAAEDSPGVLFSLIYGQFFDSAAADLAINQKAQFCEYDRAVAKVGVDRRPQHENLFSQWEQQFTGIAILRFLLFPPLMQATVQHAKGV